MNLDAFLRFGCWGSYLRYLCFEVAYSLTINSLHLHSVVSLLLEEVVELEGLHLILAKRTLEGQRSLGGGSDTLQVELVLEFAEYWVLQREHALFLLRDHQWAVLYLELTSLGGLQHERLRCDVYVLVSDGELTLLDGHLFLSRVLNDDSVHNDLADRAYELDFLDILGVLNSDVEVVEDVLS